jgi:hypothetical protein
MNRVYLYITMAASFLFVSLQPYAAHAQEESLINTIPKSYIIVAIVVGNIILFSLVRIINTKAKKMIVEKQETLKSYNTLMSAKKYDDAIALCKECFVKDSTGTYKGIWVTHDSDVLDKLIHAMNEAGRQVPPQLEDLAKEFKAQAAQETPVIEFGDKHDAVKQVIAQA